MLYRIHLSWVGFELTTLLVIYTYCIGSYKSNYHTITTTTVPSPQLGSRVEIGTVSSLCGNIDHTSWLGEADVDQYFSKIGCPLYFLALKQRGERSELNQYILSVSLSNVKTNLFYGVYQTNTCIQYSKKNLKFLTLFIYDLNNGFFEIWNHFFFSV
jgi:hypothetical protein